MAARDDYEHLSNLSTWTDHPDYLLTAAQARDALDEIDRLRSELAFANDCLTKAATYLAG